uniref:Uncharacterized protein n=1 Tax=Zea mays TaxID=4577 RepID=A0A804NV83_MAIZE
RRTPRLRSTTPPPSPAGCGSAACHSSLLFSSAPAECRPAHDDGALALVPRRPRHGQPGAAPAARVRVRPLRHVRASAVHGVHRQGDHQLLLPQVRPEPAPALHQPDVHRKLHRQPGGAAGHPGQRQQLQHVPRQPGRPRLLLHALRALGLQRVQRRRRRPPRRVLLHGVPVQPVPHQRVRQGRGAGVRRRVRDSRPAARQPRRVPRPHQRVHGRARRQRVRRRGAGHGEAALRPRRQPHRPRRQRRPLLQRHLPARGPGHRARAGRHRRQRRQQLRLGRLRRRRAAPAGVHLAQRHQAVRRRARRVAGPLRGRRRQGRLLRLLRVHRRGRLPAQLRQDVEHDRRGAARRRRQAAEEAVRLEARAGRRRAVRRRAGGARAARGPVPDEEAEEGRGRPELRVPQRHRPEEHPGRAQGVRLRGAQERHQRLRRQDEAGAGRVRRGVPRHRARGQRPQHGGGRQAVLRRQHQGAGGLPRRARHHQPPPPPESRQAHRLVPPGRRAAAGVRLHATRQPGQAPVRRQGGVGGGDDDDDAGLEAALQRGRRRGVGAELPAPRVRADGDPPRHQAVQHHAGLVVPRAAGRLRPGARARVRQDLVHGQAGRAGHAGVHRARVLPHGAGHARVGRVRLRRRGPGDRLRPPRLLRQPGGVQPAAGAGVEAPRRRAPPGGRGPAPRRRRVRVRRRGGRAAAAAGPGVQPPQPAAAAQGAGHPAEPADAVRAAAPRAHVQAGVHVARAARRRGGGRDAGVVHVAQRGHQLGRHLLVQLPLHVVVVGVQYPDLPGEQGGARRGGEGRGDRLTEKKTVSSSACCRRQDGSLTVVHVEPGGRASRQSGCALSSGVKRGLWQRGSRSNRTK